MFLPRLSTLAIIFNLVCAASPSVTFAQAAERPNVLLILADDMGFSDIGCYGGEIQTPNLDSLASNGLRFTQFYNTARCCPTRASLLTGLYPHQTGLGHMMFERNLPGYRGDLNYQCVTIAEVLKDAGYSTYAIGKWHLTRHDKPGSPRHSWPLQRGFEKYYGLIWGYSSFYDPAIVRGNEWFSRESDPEYQPETFYFTNALSDNAVTFLQQHEKESPEKPFFMYVAYTAAHWPMHALEKDIAKYKGRFDKGYDQLRRERFERLRELGLIDPKWELSPTAKSWEDVEHREWELRCMEVFAAMADSMDQGIGQIVAELKRQGKLENTLILFLQDNGGCAETRGRGPSNIPPGTQYRPLRPEELPEGTIPKQTRGGQPIRTGPEVMPGGPDSYIAYGEGWANVSNTPFREYKHWVHEGGISTPLIVHWPKVIPAAMQNTLVSEPGHLIDIMATCVDVAQTTYPAERDGHTIKPLQGVSLRPLFEKKPIRRTEPLFWEHEGNRAVRRGKWKLVAKAHEPWELYDLEADRTEMHNLADAQPELVREMAALWDDWAKRSDVLPLGGWEEPAQRRARQAAKPARLELKAGQVLEGEAAPLVHGTSLAVTVELVRPTGDGVLAAQGGKLHGYTLLVRGGKLCFEMRRDGKMHSLSAKERLGEEPVTVSAVLGAKGKLRLLVNDREVAAKSKFGLLSKTPAEPLSIGHDAGDPVGKYDSPFGYRGELGKVTVETGRK